MRRIAPYLLAVVLTCLPLSFASANLVSHTSSKPTIIATSTTVIAASKWWDDAMEWLRGISFNRARLVQIWLFFVIIALYIIMRIKMRN